ncbi:RrF2 family transcriptional regulator [Rhodothermus marinus]|uniref:RrF2 family transcriptional regulator n=1 Tax=Rhodothermus marinus TaxID=29549 RepID=UPI001FB4B3F6|nr:Rrf2 family transcriptional regulator [Rhodothermus marinus]
MLYLAALNHDGYVSIREIGERLNISVPFLTKIFQKLTQAGLMQSLRGPSGGVMFARSPEEITLFDVIVAIDGPDLFTECVLGLPGCGEAPPAPCTTTGKKCAIRSATSSPPPHWPTWPAACRKPAFA